MLEVIDYTKTNALQYAKKKKSTKSPNVICLLYSFEVEAGKLPLELFPENATVIPNSFSSSSSSSASQSMSNGRASTSPFAPLTEAIATDSSSSVAASGKEASTPAPAAAAAVAAVNEKEATRWIQRHGREPAVLRHLARLYTLSSTTGKRRDEK